MANAVYPKWKEQIIQAGANSSLAGTVKVLLIDTTSASPDVSYTYNAAHSFYNEITAGIVSDTTGGVVGITIGSHTYTNGTFDAADATFTAVSGVSIEALILYLAPGSPDISRLVLYLDTSQTGLPVTPNGGDITVTWAIGGIFTISDRRLKDDVEEIDELCGLPVYEYSYVGTERRHRGFMAQDVERVVPEAVIEVCGRKMVNYEHVIERLAA
jgi:Chaperone of endosialidase